VATFRRHANFRVITQYFQRIMLDKLLENDTPAVEHLSNDYMAQNESNVSQEELQAYFDEVLQPLEHHHHVAMSKFAWREGDPEDNGLSFLTPEPSKDKTDDAKEPKRKGKKKPEPPPEGGAAT
jgi:hypothetical protein